MTYEPDRLKGPFSDQVSESSPDQLGGSSEFIFDKWYVAARLKEVRRGADQPLSICGQTCVIKRSVGDDCTARWLADGSEAPCRVSEDLIWLFVASPERRNFDPGPVPAFGGPNGKVRFMEKVVIPAHQDDAVYGLLDPAHTPFVHRSPIWTGNGILKEKRKAFEPSPFGFTMMPHTPVKSDICTVIGGAITVRIAFRLPGLRAEYIQNSRHTVLGLTALTPIDHENTALRRIFYWDSPVLGAIRPFASLFARPFLKQDVDIMALRRQNLPYGGRGLLVGDSDKQFLWYLKLKKAWESSGRCPKKFHPPPQARCSALADRIRGRNLPDLTNSSDLESAFRPLMLAEIEDLRRLKMLSKSDRAPVELDQQSVGRVSRIDSLQVQAMANAADSRRAQRIRQLEAALGRLELGEYGYCTECGDAINRKRLEIDLAATRCVDCAP